MKKILVFLCMAVLIGFSGTAFAMTITPYDNNNNFAQSLVGSGVTISNVNYTGATEA